MSVIPTAPELAPGRSCLAALLEHFASIEDPRDVRRILHPLREVLLLVVCGTIADCDDYDAVADWGEAHVDFLRQHLPYTHGVPGGRWLTILMNRINPALFSAAFTAWVRETWHDRPEFIAIDGKTSRRSHDRAAGEAPLPVFPRPWRLGADDGRGAGHSRKLGRTTGHRNRCQRIPRAAITPWLRPDR